jgi:hypothetical protein
MWVCSGRMSRTVGTRAQHIPGPGFSAAGCPFQVAQGVGLFVVGNCNGFSGAVTNGLDTVEMKVFAGHTASLFRWAENCRV